MGLRETGLEPDLRSPKPDKLPLENTTYIAGVLEPSCTICCHELDAVNNPLSWQMKSDVCKHIATHRNTAAETETVDPQLGSLHHNLILDSLAGGEI